MKASYASTRMFVPDSLHCASPNAVIPASSSIALRVMYTGPPLSPSQLIAGAAPMTKSRGLTAVIVAVPSRFTPRPPNSSLPNPAIRTGAPTSAGPSAIMRRTASGIIGAGSASTTTPTSFAGAA